MRDENLVKRLAQIIHDHSCDCGSALHLDEDQQAARAVLDLIDTTHVPWAEHQQALRAQQETEDTLDELRALIRQER